MPVASPGMATGYSFYSQPGSFKWAMFFYSFQGIMGAGRCVSAFGPHPWRNHILVKTDQYDEGKAQYFIQEFH